MSNRLMGEDLFEALLKAAVIARCYDELGSYPLNKMIRKVDDGGVDNAIRKLIRKYNNKENFKKIFHVIVRTAAVVMILFGMSFGILLRVDDVRASCFDYIKSIYNEYIRYDILNKGEMDKLDFHVGYISKGYHLIDNHIETLISSKVYQDQQGEQMIINYETGNQITEQIDNGNCFIHNFYINDNECQSFIYDTSKKYNKLTMRVEDGLFAPFFNTLTKGRIVLIFVNYIW